MCLWGVLVCLWGVLRVRLGCLGEVFGGLWSLEGVLGELGRVQNTVYYVCEWAWGSLVRLWGIFSFKSRAAVIDFHAFSQKCTPPQREAWFLLPYIRVWHPKFEETLLKVSVVA